jgi:Putative beta-lactamase-inhibitor-like, PepSY-like
MLIQGTRIPALFLLAASVLASGNAQGSEKKVKMRDLPKAVQKTVQEQSKGATISGLSKEVEHGKTYYEVELKVNGHGKDVLIDSAGAIVEVEEEVTMASLAPAVKTAIEARAGKGRITRVESITKNNALVAYEAQVNTAGKRSEIKVGPQGQAIDNENEEDEAREKATGKKPRSTSKKP